MSPKQEIYRELIRSAVIHIRNVQSRPFWRRWRDRSAYEEAELIHNLWPSLFEPDFCAHDLWFLNSPAHNYWKFAKSSLSYHRHLALIRELLAIVPEHLRPQLGWTCPPE